ncbi:MAG: alpha/beta hydrolase [Aestuariivirgaceae bacterium]
MTFKAMMSDEALQFVENAPPLQYEPLEGADIDKYRADVRAGFAPASESATERHKVVTRQVEIAGVPCMEVTPAHDQSSFTVLYHYGGGYVTGSPFEDLPITAALCDHLKARLVVTHYRLAPEHPFPAALDDALAVYQSISQSCAAGTWAIAGESAGGNLTLSVLQRAQADGLPMPVAAALMSPWCDLCNQGDSITSNADRDPTLHPEHLFEAARAYAGERELSDAGISPLYGTFGEKFPPVIITTGTRDILMSHCVRLSRVLREAGRPVDLRVWDGLWHVFEFYDELPEAAASLREIADFLDGHLAGP